MSIRLKYFTVEEAEALIPRMTEILRAALDTKVKIEEKIAEWRKGAETMKVADSAVYQGQVEFLAAQLEKQLEGITETGALPKDLEEGLVDFPARIEGREAHLCWRLGETKITHWHGLTEGYSGRRPLGLKKEDNGKSHS